MSSDDKKIDPPIRVLGEKNNEEKSSELLEFKLSWAGKMFFASVAAFILGDKMSKMSTPIKLRGNPEQLKVLIDTIMSSKRFQQEINKPGASVDSVIDKLQLKNLSKERYEKLTGKKWPL